MFQEGRAYAIRSEHASRYSAANSDMTYLVVGGGPAGLMAAEQMARAGLSVLVVDAKPSLGRKFLMAGKSGLNLTKDEASSAFLDAYDEAVPALRPMIEAFGPSDVVTWAEGLGQSLFTGSTGRVFPDVMKASPLLRAWLARLAAMGVETRTRWRWTGWQGEALAFDTPEGHQVITPKATVLALGGASWSRLGSDGAWAGLLTDKGVTLAPFQPSNVGLRITWSDHMAPLMGEPVKAVAFHAGSEISRGEAVISAKGLEGGGIYMLSKPIRNGAPLTIDLMPDLTEEQVAQRLNAPRGKASLSNHLRKQLKLGKIRTALLNEFGRPLPADTGDLARLIKSLPVVHEGLGDMEGAISTAGGVPFAALDDNLMLRALPNVYCVGEMLDWEAPTGGYLLTACFATGAWAGRAISDRLA